jgi:hypothetical protein
MRLPAGVALDVRNAARLHEQYPEQWEALLAGEVRPAEVVCSFATEPWEPADVYWQTTRHFGSDCSLDTTRMPLLLRDFRAGGRGWNSFDWDGHYRPSRFELNGSKWQDFPGSWLDQPPGFSYDNGRWTMSYSGSYNSSSSGIDVRIFHAWAPLPNGIPTYWKAMQIARPIYFAKPSARERIQIIVREDIAEPGPNVGHMSYQYIIPFERTGDNWRTMTATADFTIHCGRETDGRWTAEFISGDNLRAAFAPGIQRGAALMGRSGQEYSVEETLSALTPILTRLCSSQQSLDLHNIMGGPFFANPPKELIDLVA